MVIEAFRMRSGLDAAFGNEENVVRHQRPQTEARIEGDRKIL